MLLGREIAGLDECVREGGREGGGKEGKEK